MPSPSPCYGRATPVCLSVSTAAPVAAANPTCAYMQRRRDYRHLGHRRSLTLNEVINDRDGRTNAALPHSDVYSCGEDGEGGNGIAVGRAALFGVAVTASAADELLSCLTDGYLFGSAEQANSAGPQLGRPRHLRESWPPRPSSPRGKATGGSLIHSLLTLPSFDHSH